MTGAITSTAPAGSLVSSYCPEYISIIDEAINQAELGLKNLFPEARKERMASVRKQADAILMQLNLLQQDGSKQGDLKKTAQIFAADLKKIIKRPYDESFFTSANREFDRQIATLGIPTPKLVSFPSSQELRDCLRRTPMFGIDPGTQMYIAEKVANAFAHTEKYEDGIYTEVLQVLESIRVLIPPAHLDGIIQVLETCATTDETPPAAPTEDIADSLFLEIVGGSAGLPGTRW